MIFSSLIKNFKNSQKIKSFETKNFLFIIVLIDFELMPINKNPS